MKELSTDSPRTCLDIMNYLDRNSIGSARLAGLEADLGLKASEYQVRQIESQPPALCSCFISPSPC